jgi:hypothetical protein
MQTSLSTTAADARLRIVFDACVRSFELAANATFGDVALKLGDTALRGYGAPRAIDVAWSVPAYRAH